MCGRSTLTVNEAELEKRFGSTFYSEDLERYNPLPNFNIAPTHFLPTLPMTASTHFHWMRWGLIPFWAKDASVASKMINARMETLMEKPAFKRSFISKRCIVPLDGYYEWKKEGKRRIPYRILLKSGDVFGVGAIFDTWKMPDGTPLATFSIITQPAPAMIADIHDRMPVILDRQSERDWLDHNIVPSELLELPKLFNPEALTFYRVSDQVNKVANNDESLIAPYKEFPDPPSDTGQLKLF